VALVLVGLAVVNGCTGDTETAGAAAGSRNGGDGRNGEYTAAENWWRPAPNHTDGSYYGSASGVVADNPDRILVGITGDRNADGERMAYNYIIAVNGNGDIIENWTQWDTMVAFPHQLYISPYDPERHIWIVERGGGGDRDIHEQVFKFTNDGKQLVMRLRDPNPRQSEADVRANKNPGPLDFGQASTLAFFPNGDFLLGDGYQNGRIVRYSAEGEFISEFGSVGGGPGQFELIHGVAVDREHRIYVSDRDNNRIQIFTEGGDLIEEWSDITGPTGIYIDERENVWVLSTTLNQILQYNMNGELLQNFGAYCCTRGGFEGGLSRPHQMTVDHDGNVYISNFDAGQALGQPGGYVTKFTPMPGADPNMLVGGPLVLEN
jgi:sugar lactone lactonase YvrE